MEFQTRNRQQGELDARKLNKMARRLLQDKLLALESSYRKQEKVTYRQTKSLEFELRCPSNELHSVEDLPSTNDEVERKLHRPSPSPQSSSCRFHPKSSNCRYFPCQRLTTYHSIGHNIRATAGKDGDGGGSTTYVFLDGVARAVKDLPTKDEIEGNAHASARISIHDRERGLKQLVKEMKQRNNEQRPKAWATNYGDPVTQRQLIKPVIPVSDNDVSS